MAKFIMRKIIQVIHEPAEGEGHFQVLWALCDDGSLWCWALGAANAAWQRFDDVPQPDADPDPNHT